MNDAPKSSSPLHNFGNDVLEKADRDTLLRVVRAVIGVGGVLDSVHNLQHVLDQIMHESEKAVDAETSSLLLFDSETNELTFKVAHPPKEDESINNVRLPLDENSIAGTAALTRSPVNVPDVRYDPRWNWTVDEQTRFLTRSILAVPMLRQDRLIGIIEVLNKRGEEGFSHEDTQILLLLGSLAAMAIENATLFEKNIQAERLGALGQAVAGISHYVKNILSGLEGCMTVINQAVKEQDWPTIEKANDLLNRNVMRVSDLVKDMLCYSKGRTPELAPCQPNKVVLEVSDLISISPNALGIEFTHELESSIPVILLDREILERIILNLLMNAVDAVCLRRSEDEDIHGKINLKTGYAKGIFTLSVEDNGIGIADWDIPKIWGPFFSTKGSSGTGLGLAVSRKLAEDARGSITVSSQPGKGSIFTLSLPAAPAEA